MNKIRKFKTKFMLLSLTTAIVATPLITLSCSSDITPEVNEEDIVRTFTNYTLEDMEHASKRKVTLTTDYGNIKTLAYSNYLPFVNSYINVAESNKQKRIVYHGEDETIKSINDFERAKVREAKEIYHNVMYDERGNMRDDDTLSSIRRLLVNNQNIATEIRTINNIASGTEGIKEDVESSVDFDNKKSNPSNAYIFAKLGISSAPIYNIYTAMNNVNYKTKDGYQNNIDVSNRKVSRQWANINYADIKNDTFAYYSPTLYPEITSTHAFFKFDSRFAKWLGEDRVSKQANADTDYIMLSDEEGGVKSGFSRTINGKTQFVEESEGIETFEEVDKIEDINSENFENGAYYFINTSESVPGTIYPSWQYKIKMGADGENFGYFENVTNGVKTFMPLKNISYSVEWKRHSSDLTKTKHYFGVTTNIEPVDITSGVGKKDADARDKIFGAFSSSSVAKDSLVLKKVSKGIYVNGKNKHSANDLVLDLSNRSTKIFTPDTNIVPGDTGQEFNHFFLDGELVLSKRVISE